MPARALRTALSYTAKDAPISKHPAMARDQLPVLTDEAGHGPTELGHAGGDLGDLVGPVHLRVLGVGLELGQRPGFDPLGGEAQRHGRVVSDVMVDAGRIPDTGCGAGPHAGSGGVRGILPEGLRSLGLGG